MKYGISVLNLLIACSVMSLNGMDYFKNWLSKSPVSPKRSKLNFPQETCLHCKVTPVTYNPETMPNLGSLKHYVLEAYVEKGSTIPDGYQEESEQEFDNGKQRFVGSMRFGVDDSHEIKIRTLYLSDEFKLDAYRDAMMRAMKLFNEQQKN